MKKTLLSGLALLCLLIFCSSFLGTRKPIKILLAGDSTVKSYDTAQTEMRGWGQYLQTHFNDNVEVINHSEGGRSSGSFLREGRWDRLLKQVSPGDYVLIQFGHNDTSTKPERHVDPEQFTANLIRFSNDVRARKGTAILVTPIAMREFENGQLVAKRPHFAEYAQRMRDAAHAADIKLIDLNRMTSDWIQELGDSASIELYYWVGAKKDNTHLREKGAQAYAAFVAKSIQEQRIRPLYRYLKR
jgi:lysophospholipase L1-like esterase